MDTGFGAGGQLAGESTPALQPRDPKLGSAALVDSRELREFDGTVAARHLARLAADQEIMLKLSAEGFEGTAWPEVSEALVQYGWAVMRAWIVTGQVFVKCREKRLGGSKLAPPREGMPRDDALALADDTVADAIVNFRDKVLARGKWDPSKGASLATFFIGNCLLQFVNNYRKWRSSTARDRAIEVGESDWRASDDPADVLVENERVRELLGPIGEASNRAILQLNADGHAIDEIALLLDMTYKQVEARLYRIRQVLGRHNQKAG